MILEAAKRSANSSHPLSYMNKLLSEWKRTGAFSAAEIPEKTSPVATYKSEAAIAADKRTEREQFYAARRQKALSLAEAARANAEEGLKEIADYVTGSNNDAGLAAAIRKFILSV